LQRYNFFSIPPPFDKNKLINCLLAFYNSYPIKEKNKQQKNKALNGKITAIISFEALLFAA
jgi:hypothetical protein